MEGEAMLKALYEQPVDLVMNVAAWGVEQVARGLGAVNRRLIGGGEPRGKRVTKTPRAAKG
jgi:hypothetical protein